MSTPPKLKRSIKKEYISPGDFFKYKIPMSCEDCSHYSMTNDKCTLGNNTLEHRRAAQLKSYELSGTVAFCRLHEID